jgi:hypothetical protein
LALFSVGCATGPDEKDGSLTGDQAQVPVFFDNIPANTPYVFTSLKPFPMELMEPYLRLYGNLSAQTMQQMNAAGMGSQAQSPVAQRLTWALLDEFSAISTMEGFKQLGFSTRPQMAIYGIGWFPVFRLTLGDAQAFEALLDRLDKKAGLVPQMRTLGTTVYRQYNVADGQAKVAVAVADGQLIMGFGPTKVFDDFVAYMLGKKDVGRSLADVDTIQHIQARYELTPYAVGYVDILNIVKAATGAAPADPITAAMLRGADYQLNGVSDICRREIVAIADDMPRAVVGYTALSPEVMEMKMVLETRGDFAAELAAIGAPIPGNSEALVERSFFAFGLGIDMNKALAFVQNQANRINKDPFECPELQGINKAAQNVPMTLAMIPPVVTSLSGAFAAVTEMQMGPNTQAVKGLALLQTSDPMALFSVLRQFIPQLQSVQVKPDGVPVALPAISGAPQIETPHLVMDHNTLGGSVGVGMQDEVAVLLEQSETSVDPADPLLFFAYDYGELMNQIVNMGGATPGSTPEAIETMSRILGTFVMGVSASKHGIEMNYRITMHPERAAAAARAPAATP